MAIDITLNQKRSSLLISTLVVSIDFYVLGKKSSFYRNIADLMEARLQTINYTFIPVYTDASKDPNTGSTGFASSTPAL